MVHFMKLFIVDNFKDIIHNLKCLIFRMGVHIYML
jgi:hypothetical protein